MGTKQVDEIQDRILRNFERDSKSSTRSSKVEQTLKQQLENQKEKDKMTPEEIQKNKPSDRWYFDLHEFIKKEGGIPATKADSLMGFKNKAKMEEFRLAGITYKEIHRWMQEQMGKMR